jgi:isoaspartyl peptidase/L-asparaginase-like protein (Ntn-hydrolase superfamily)
MECLLGQKKHSSVFGRMGDSMLPTAGFWSLDKTTKATTVAVSLNLSL